jgi:glutaredoxin
MNSEIKVYGKSGCPRCSMVKTILAKKEIEYEYIDLYSLSKEEQDRILSVAKSSKDQVVFPIILKNDISVFVSEL